MTNDPEAMPRSLTHRESEILDLLLSLDAAGVAELRKQQRTARVVDTCPCGCATISLSVDREATPPSPLGRRYGPAVEATTRPLPRGMWREPDDRDVSFGVTLWVDEDGWLSQLEISDFILDDPGNANPFPAPEEFYPPQLYDRKRASHVRKRRFRIWRR